MLTAPIYTSDEGAPEESHNGTCRQLTGFFMLAGCNLTEPFDIENLSEGRIYIIGHGGSGFQEYDNPWPAKRFDRAHIGAAGSNGP